MYPPAAAVVVQVGGRAGRRGPQRRCPDVVYSRSPSTAPGWHRTLLGTSGNVRLAVYDPCEEEVARCGWPDLASAGGCAGPCDLPSGMLSPPPARPAGTDATQWRKNLELVARQAGFRDPAALDDGVYRRRDVFGTADSMTRSESGDSDLMRLTDNPAADAFVSAALACIKQRSTSADGLAATFASPATTTPEGYYPGRTAPPRTRVRCRRA